METRVFALIARKGEKGKRRKGKKGKRKKIIFMGWSLMSRKTSMR